MDALQARNTRKILLFAAVACAHALVIALLLSESQNLHLAGAHVPPIRAFLLLPVRRRPRLPFAAARLRPPPLSVEPITAPITLTLPAANRPLRVARPINWARSAHQAVQAILKRTKSVTIGFPKGARSVSKLQSAPSGIRSQGPESYRTRTGESFSRTSGNCYLVSSPAPLDASQLEQQAQLSRVECSGSQRGPSPDNLFKSLPAYKRYHSLPPNVAHPKRRKKVRRKRPVPSPGP